MCVVSMVGDEWSRIDRWPKWPTQIPFPDRTPITPSVPYPFKSIEDEVSLKEFNELKKQVEEMKHQLENAKKQDIEDGNPECEMEEKVIILKKIAKMFNIDLNEVFEN